VQAGAEAHPEVALFFYAFVIIGGFFAVNLFVGVVVDQFGRMKDEFEGSALLTKDQQQWCVCSSCLRQGHVQPSLGGRAVGVYQFGGTHTETVTHTVTQLRSGS
jgi:hypothetical protein